MIKETEISLTGQAVFVIVILVGLGLFVGLAVYQDYRSPFYRSSTGDCECEKVGD